MIENNQNKFGLSKISQYNNIIRKEPYEREREMSEQEYQNYFNELIRDISELLEVSGNESLVRCVKKKLFDFSDKIKGERVNEQNK